MNKKTVFFIVGGVLLGVGIIRGIMINDWSMSDNMMIICYFFGGWSIVIGLWMRRK